MSLERRSFCKARQEIHLPYPWRVYFLIISGHFRTSSHDFSPHWHEMAELNNHAVLHEEEDTEDGECVDRCCYVILNLKSVFESFAFAMQLSGHGKQLINKLDHCFLLLKVSFVIHLFICHDLALMQLFLLNVNRLFCMVAVWRRFRSIQELLILNHLYWSLASHWP